MSLYVRQLAWLNTAPKPETKNGKTAAVSDDRTRIARMRADGMDIPLPPVSAPWLVEALMEIGPVVAAGMGVGPVGWRDIADWASLTGTPLRPWEARTIRRLSSDWLASVHTAEKPDCPAPWMDAEAVAANREAIGRKLSGELAALRR